MLRFKERPTTPDELAVLARRALGSVLGDLVELAGTGGRTGARAQRLLKDVAAAVASKGGATEKPEAADGGDTSRPSFHPTT